MSSPSIVLQKLESINVDLSAKVAMENTASDATKAQRGQLFQGLTKDETPIIPPYSPGTVARKKKKKQPFNRVTLKDTGDFYRGILIDVRGEDVVFESADSKSGDLQKRYSKKIFGLGPAAKEKWIKKLRPEFIKQINSYMK